MKYILLLGEGNFSFAASLSIDLEKRASSVDIQKYRLIATDIKGTSSSKNKSQSLQDLTATNTQIIKSNNGIVFMDVDATKLESHTGLADYVDPIEKIIFNFPHVKRKKMHIGENRDLLKNFFISANKFIPNERANDVKIIVSLCSGQSGINEIETVTRVWADSWQIVEQATYGNYVLIDIQKFTKQEFYTNCGFKDRLSSSFNTEDANTFTFVRREPLLPPEFLLEEKGFVEKISKLDFLKTLKESHSLQGVIKSIGKLDDLKLRAEIDYNAMECPFVHLWIDNLEIESTVQKLNFLEISQSDSAVKYNNVCIGNIVNGKISINLTKLVIIKYNVEDSRVLFSKYACSIDSKGDNNNIIETGSLYPREHKWDVSFWITGPNFSPQKFIETCINVYGLLLKSVKLIEVFTRNVGIEGDLDSLQVSNCYRITIQSVDLGISRIRANEYHVLFRQYLENKLDVKLR